MYEGRETAFKGEWWSIDNSTNHFLRIVCFSKSYLWWEKMATIWTYGGVTKEGKSFGEWLATNIQTRDVSWPKFPWIECEWDFTFHHLRETWNPWMTIFPIYWDFEWIRSKFLCEFIWIHWNSWNRARTGFHNHNLELKWNVIQWNAKNCFQEWIFYKHEFTHPSLICR